MEVTNLPDIGKKIQIIGRHPHAGKSGTVLNHELAAFTRTKGAIIESDNGVKFFIFNPCDWEYVQKKQVDNA